MTKELKEMKYRKSVANYFITVGDIFSTFLNHVLLLSFDGNQSLSGRCFENRHHWFFGSLRKIIDFIFTKWEEDHCEKSFISDGRRGATMHKKVQDWLNSEEYKERKNKKK